MSIKRSYPFKWEKPSKKNKVSEQHSGIFIFKHLHNVLVFGWIRYTYGLCYQFLGKLVENYLCWLTITNIHDNGVLIHKQITVSPIIVSLTQQYECCYKIHLTMKNNIFLFDKYGEVIKGTLKYGIKYPNYEQNQARPLSNFVGSKWLFTYNGGCEKYEFYVDTDNTETDTFFDVTFYCQIGNVVGIHINGCTVPLSMFGGNYNTIDDPYIKVECVDCVSLTF